MTGTPTEWTDAQAGALLELVNAVSRHRERAPLFDELNAALSEMFRFDVLGVVTAGPGPDELTPYVVRPRMTLPIFRRSQSALRQVFETRAPVYVRDRQQAAANPATIAMLERMESHSYLALPLIARDRVIGVLIFQSLRPRAFDDIDLPYAQEAASVVAVALDNCMAYERVQRTRERIEAQNAVIRGELEATYGSHRIVAESEAMKHVMRLVERVAPTDATVLITGESGTGKELVARAVHEKSPRARRPLTKLNCAAMPSGLVESELFGHEEGAFTGATKRRRGRFEMADHGTLFLDEIGELPPEAQAKLLRVLQHQELERVGSGETIKVDVRIIAATNRDLVEMARNGKFRQDLYYRLAVFPMHIPALRERPEDIPPLVNQFIREAAARLGRTCPPRDEVAMATLQAYRWPGNVRELENVVERAMILGRGGPVEIGELLQ